MRLVLLLVTGSLLVSTAIIVHENAAQTASMTAFGKTVFEGLSVPVLILVSIMAGMILMLPFVARARYRNRKKGSADKTIKESTEDSEA